MDPVQALEAAFAHTGQIVNSITPEQMTASTPCSEWNVSALLEHTSGSIRGLGGAVGAPAVADDASFDEVTSAAMQGWQSFDMNSKVDFPMPDTPGAVVAAIQLMDVCGHAWDLAKATGQSAELPADVAAAAMAASQMVVSDELREGRFGAAIDAPDASASGQFAAFLGRQPDWA